MWSHKAAVILPSVNTQEIVAALDAEIARLRKTGLANDYAIVRPAAGPAIAAMRLNRD